MKSITTFSLIVLSSAAFARGAQPNANQFVQSQTQAEVSRLAAQFDVLNQNLDDVSSRLHRLENKGEDSSTRREIEAIKASIEELRRDMAKQRSDIIKDVSQLLAKTQSSQNSRSETKNVKPSEREHMGPCQEYVVQSGDSLYLIAKAFNTTVQKVKDMNGLKNNNLRVGQKILVPKN